MKKKLREHGCFRSWVFIYRLRGGGGDGNQRLGLMSTF